jgi:hypothetical protein
VHLKIFSNIERYSLELLKLKKDSSAIDIIDEKFVLEF